MCCRTCYFCINCYITCSSQQHTRLTCLYLPWELAKWGSISSDNILIDILNHFCFCFVVGIRASNLHKIPSPFTSELGLDAFALSLINTEKWRFFWNKRFSVNWYRRLHQNLIMTVEPENRLHFPYIINALEILICHVQGYVEMTFKEPKLLAKLISTIQVLYKNNFLGSWIILKL